MPVIHATGSCQSTKNRQRELLRSGFEVGSIIPAYFAADSSGLRVELEEHGGKAAMKLASLSSSQRRDVRNRLLRSVHFRSGFKVAEVVIAQTDATGNSSSRCFFSFLIGRS